MNAGACLAYSANCSGFRVRVFVTTTEAAMNLLCLNANVSFIGAAGNIGKRIVREALDRHHEVTAVGRHPERLDLRDGKLSTAAADVTAAGIAIVDELEKPQAIRRRITVAY